MNHQQQKSPFNKKDQNLVSSSANISPAKPLSRSNGGDNNQASEQQNEPPQISIGDYENLKQLCDRLTREKNEQRIYIAQKLEEAKIQEQKLRQQFSMDEKCQDFIKSTLQLENIKLQAELNDKSVNLGSYFFFFFTFSIPRKHNQNTINDNIYIKIVERFQYLNAKSEAEIKDSNRLVKSLQVCLLLLVLAKSCFSLAKLVLMRSQMRKPSLLINISLQSELSQKTKEHNRQYAKLETEFEQFKLQIQVGFPPYFPQPHKSDEQCAFFL